MNFIEGETLLVDKPLGWTSFDAVNKLRWHLKTALKLKKIKVGHAGTLDPLATGLLIICTGKNTKKIEGLTNDSKTYTGTFLIGKTTPSFDLETEYNQDFPTEHITEDLLETVRQSFLGEQLQTPPIFSAKLIDGKRAYEYARKGREVEMKRNLIHIFDFQIDSSRFPEVDFEISCSKGTYIRSIANDFGEKLNSGATLIALRRTRSGEFDVQNALAPEAWIEKFKLLTENQLTNELND
ncbi:MAG: tRNA pseudouridine(55) synthase TruB [Bacteroidota bacterium]|jgi:tRNA pseudouridine55 synthase